MKIYDELRKKISVNNEEGFIEVNAYISCINSDHGQKLYFYLMDAKNPRTDLQIGKHPYDYVIAKAPGADENKYSGPMAEAKKIFGIFTMNFLQYFAKSELKFLKYSRITNKQEFRNTLKTLEQVVRFDERMTDEASGFRIKLVGRNDFDFEKTKKAFDILKGLQ